MVDLGRPSGQLDTGDAHSLSFAQCTWWVVGYTSVLVCFPAELCELRAPQRRQRPMAALLESSEVLTRRRLVYNKGEGKQVCCPETGRHTALVV